MKQSLAVTKNGKDYIRIIPFNSTGNKTELKISFLKSNFKVRKFIKDKSKEGIIYQALDCADIDHEVTYHNPTNHHPFPSLLPKYKDKEIKRVPLLNELIELNLKNILAPIPICRITINEDINRRYKKKEKHYNIDLNSRYNTVDIYVSSKKYDYRLMTERFPMIIGNLFSLITIDFLIYGAGMASEPLFQKMFNENSPVVGLESCVVGDIAFYSKVYEVHKTDKFRLTANKEYSTDNMIEFFNNINYEALLSTTRVGFPIKGTNKVKSKLAYEWDLKHLKNIGFYKDYIKRHSKRFDTYKSILGNSMKSRSGIIFK